MIADRYLERRFKEGYEVGWQEGIKLGREEALEELRQEGWEEGREKSRQHIKEVLEKAGIDLPPEVREQLFGSPDRKSDT